MNRTKTMVAGVAALAFALGGASAAFAGQSTPGIPGTASCKGQTTAYVAQGNPIPGVSANGIGNVAAANGVSTKAVQANIAAFCAVP
jgi:hypothetical protein